MFPLLLFKPPVIFAPPDETVSNPPIVWPTVKLLFWPLYATLVRVPVVLIFVPLSNIPVAALIEPVTARLPVVPLSVRVRRVLGTASASVIVRTPSLPAVASETTGLLSDRARGVALDNVTSPEAVISVAPAIAPAPVIPPPLFVIPPVIFAPPALIDNPPVVIVCAAVNELD